MALEVGSRLGHYDVTPSLARGQVSQAELTMKPVFNTQSEHDITKDLSNDQN